jgi:hypothetical protein
MGSAAQVLASASAAGPQMCLLVAHPVSISGEESKQMEIVAPATYQGRACRRRQLEASGRPIMLQGPRTDTYIQKALVFTPVLAGSIT